MSGADLIVIGAGMAGINAAARAVEAEASVVVIERDRVGGTCPLRGCIPSKALIRSAEVAHEARTAAAYGVSAGPVSVDMGAVADRVQGIIDKGGAGARAYLESLPGLRLVMGEARFEEPGVLSVGGERIAAPRVLVATGAAPVTPPIPGLAETPHLTSTDALTLRELPGRLLVIGAGPIGLELGQALSRLGAAVTLIDQAPRLLMQADPAMGEALAELLAAEGIELVLDARIERVESRPDGGPRITVTRDGATRELDGDAILLGAGRGPDLEALHPAGAGIETNGKGVPVDARLETSQPGHFAAGDVLGPPYGPFTHTARQLGRDAASNALGADPHDANPDVGPWAVFTDPEFTMVGMTEQAAREAGHDVGVGTSEFSGGKARAWGQERGLVTAVVDRTAGSILGAQILGYHAADLIHPVVVAMRAGDPDALLGAYHVHPTLGETVQGAVRSAFSG
ncbi:MAG: FAD-dependent oxidoreductase [Thermoleophilia bacterium]|nr:FAD-dependent oxidoreductase [Thermoleophilia bacterium]